METTEEALADERHATNLELFLDLVFVFAVTQITSAIANDLTWPGVGRGLLIAWLMWWLWSQYTWAGTALDLERSRVDRVMVLATIPWALLLAIVIPRAFDDLGRWFAVLYLVVQLWVLGMQGRNAWRDLQHRSSWIRYASVVCIAPLILVVGSFAEGRARVVWWMVASGLEVLGGFAAGLRRFDATTEWHINPTHFAERHSLFVIISLGESLVAIGATATGGLDQQGLPARVGVAVVCCVVVAAVMWWVYFAFIPRVGETRLADLVAGERARLARDVYSFGHFPIVAGIVLFAVAAKHVVAHPEDGLALSDRWVLAGSALAFIGGLLCVQLRIVRRAAPERLAAIAVVAGVAFGATALDGPLVILVVALVYGVMQAITVRRFAGSELGSRVLGR